MSTAVITVCEKLMLSPYYDSCCIMGSKQRTNDQYLKQTFYTSSNSVNS